MAGPLDDLRAMHSRLAAEKERLLPPLDHVSKDLAALEAPLKDVVASWSGSDLGYHARLYYEGLERPPLQRSFDVEWGGLHGLEGWVEVDVEQIQEAVEGTAGITLAELDKRVDGTVEVCKTLATEVTIAMAPVSTLDGLEREADLLVQLESFSWETRPSLSGGGGYRISRDSRAVSEGPRVPPHRVYGGRIAITVSKVEACGRFFELASRLLRQTVKVIEAREGEYVAAGEQTSDRIAPALTLCRRFDHVVRQLGTRQRGRPPFQVDDEYDVQDLLHALLWLHFEDVRAEEWTPSYAGGSARMDFLLKRERIVVEVKRARDGLDDRQLGDELTIDVARYAEHPHCDVLLCFVYDPGKRVQNPRGLEDDLGNLTSERLQVVALVA
jgi:hypothetical protein